MTSYLVDAIKLLKPTAEFSFTDNDYSTIKWDVLEGIYYGKPKQYHKLVDEYLKKHNII